MINGVRHHYSSRGGSGGSLCARHWRRGAKGQSVMNAVHGVIESIVNFANGVIDHSPRTGQHWSQMGAWEQVLRLILNSVCESYGRLYTGASRQRGRGGAYSSNSSSVLYQIVRNYRKWECASIVRAVQELVHLRHRPRRQRGNQKIGAELIFRASILIRTAVRRATGG